MLGFGLIYAHILAKKRVGSGDLGSKTRKVFKSNRTVRAIMAFLYSVGTHGCSVLNNFGAHSGEKASQQRAIVRYIFCRIGKFVKNLRYLKRLVRKPARCCVYFLVCLGVGRVSPQP